MSTPPKDRFQELCAQFSDDGGPSNIGLVVPTRMDRPFYRAMQESQFLTFFTRATRVLCY
jgi:hypothetical protein